MTSFDKRGVDNRLLSPDNSLLTIIDYQPIQIGSIGSMRHADLLKTPKWSLRPQNYSTYPLCFRL